MSFIDYGFEIFAFGSDYQKDYFQSCGNYILEDDAWNSNPLKNPYYDNVVNYLINLGACAEKELEIYKTLKLTDKQTEQLKHLRLDNRYLEDHRLIKSSNLETRFPSFVIEYSPKKYDTASNTLHKGKNQLCSSNSALENDSNDTHKLHLDYKNKFSNCNATYGSSNRTCISNGAFLMTIIQRDSQIVSLKNQNAAKKIELKEVQECNKKLELYVDELKSKIEQLRTSSKAYKTQIDDIIQQKNKELDILKENREKLEQELKDEQQSRKSDVDEISKLQNLILNTEASRQNLVDELKTMKRHMETLESSNISQTHVIKKLQQECDNFEKQNEKEENEIERLLSIIQRLSDKYDKSKSKLTFDLSVTKDEVEVSERRRLQYRDQLTTMEQEVSQLIADLAECLGPNESQESSGQEDSECAKTRELTRGFVRIVREHEKCREHRIDLLKEIERLTNANRVNAGLEHIKREAHKEVARLKEIILRSENYQRIKMDAKYIFQHLLSLLDTNRIEKPEQSCLKVVNESVVLDKFDKKQNDQEVYKKFESLLVLELENMQKSLKGVKKTLNALPFDESSDSSPKRNLNSNSEMKSMNTIHEEEEKQYDENDDNCDYIEKLSKKFVYKIQNCNKLIISINTSLRNATEFKQNYNELDNKLQKALSTLNKTAAEKCQLQNKYDDCQKKCRVFATELEKMEVSLNDKSRDLETLTKKMQSSFEFYRQEKETMQKQIITAEAKFQQSVAEVITMTKTSDDMIRNLQMKLQNQNLKTHEYNKTIDALNTKLKDSEMIIEQLRNMNKHENAHNPDTDKFITNHNKVIELIKDKNDLIDKRSNLQLQILNVEKDNNKAQYNLTKILEDNQYLEACNQYLKRENEFLVSNIIKQDANKVNLGSKCNELLEKVEKISKNSKQNQKRTVSDTMIRGLEKEIKNQKEKLRYQQKELLMKEREIIEKNKNIELLSSQVNKAKTISVNDNSAALLKEIETLTSEKYKLENELKQTLIKHEDKLTEMHKQYKQLEIELHKNHSDSKKHLEIKLTTMNKEDKILNSRNWFESLNKNQFKNLHNQICKTSRSTNNAYGNEIFEDQRNKLLNKYNSTKFNNRKPVQVKKDLRNMNISSASSIKLNPRQRLPSKETLNRRSVIIPEKDYSQLIKPRNK